MAKFKNCFCKIACTCGEELFSAETSLDADKIKIICKDCGNTVFTFSRYTLEEMAEEEKHNELN